jgi:hypothetical protein
MKSFEFDSCFRETSEGFSKPHPDVVQAAYLFHTSLKNVENAGSFDQRSRENLAKATGSPQNSLANISLWPSVSTAAGAAAYT